MPSSKTMPSLDRSPKKNWVEKKGGLPSYIERIAKHIHYDGAKSISHAIASAINTVKRWAAGGTVKENGGPTVNADTQAKSAAALAQWNAMKASAHASVGMEEADLVLACASIWEDKLELEAKTGTPLSDGFFLSLARERESLGLTPAVKGGILLSVSHVTTFDFDPNEHPRDLLGRFKSVVGGLKSGESVELPDGIRVTNTGKKVPKVPGSKTRVTTYDITHKNATRGSAAKDPETAAQVALNSSAGREHEKSLGGAKRFDLEEADSKSAGGPGHGSKNAYESAQEADGVEQMKEAGANLAASLEDLVEDPTADGPVKDALDAWQTAYESGDKKALHEAGADVANEIYENHEDPAQDKHLGESLDGWAGIFGESLYDPDAEDYADNPLGSKSEKKEDTGVNAETALPVVEALKPGESFQGTLSGIAHLEDGTYRTWDSAGESQTHDNAKDAVAATDFSSYWATPLRAGGPDPELYAQAGKPKTEPDATLNDGTEISFKDATHLGEKPTEAKLLNTLQTMRDGDSVLTGVDDKDTAITKTSHGFQVYMYDDDEGEWGQMNVGTDESGVVSELMDVDGVELPDAGGNLSDGSRVTSGGITLHPDGTETTKDGKKRTPVSANEIHAMDHDQADEALKTAKDGVLEDLENMGPQHGEKSPIQAMAHNEAVARGNKPNAEPIEVKGKHEPVHPEDQTALAEINGEAPDPTPEGETTWGDNAEVYFEDREDAVQQLDDWFNAELSAGGRMTDDELAGYRETAGELAIQGVVAMSGELDAAEKLGYKPTEDGSGVVLPDGSEIGIDERGSVYEHKNRSRQGKVR